MEVWRLTYQQKKSSPVCPVRKMRPIYGEGRHQATKGAQYAFTFFTTEKIGPVVLRSCTAELTLYFSHLSEPVRISKTVNYQQTSEQFSFRLEAGQSVKWTLTVNSPALLKQVEFGAHLMQCEDDHLLGGTPMEDTPSQPKDRLQEELSKEEKDLLKAVMKQWYGDNPQDHTLYYYQKSSEEMAKNTKWKKKAFELGLIRPFLLFVSMDPQERLQWALFLEVKFIQKPYYPDPHREAYKMLTRQQTGLQARASHAFTESVRPLVPNATWYQILHRVSRYMLDKEEMQKSMKYEMNVVRLLYDDSLVASQRPKDRQMYRMEEIFSLILYHIGKENVRVSNMSLHNELLSLIENTKCVDMAARVDRMKAAGYTDNDLCRYLVASAVMMEDASMTSDGVEGWISSKADSDTRQKVAMAMPLAMISAQLALGFTSPLTVIPLFMLARNTTAYLLRETPGLLISPLMGLLRQKNMLALKGVYVDDFVNLHELLHLEE